MLKVIFLIFFSLTLINCATNVLLITGDTQGVNTTRDNIMNYLNATNLLGSISFFNAAQQTPNITDFNNINSVLVYVFDAFFNSTSLASVLATYIENGGGVVLAMDATGSLNSSETLPFNGSLYGVLNYGLEPVNCSNSNLGNTTNNTDAQAIMNTVTNFTMGNGSICSAANSTQIQSGAFVVSTFSDGSVIAAARSNAGTSGNRRRVDLSFFPDNDGIVGFVSNTRGSFLVANALVWAGVNSFPTTTAPTTTAPTTTAPTTTAPTTTAPTTTAPTTTAPTTTAPTPTNAPQCSVTTFSGSFIVDSTACLSTAPDNCCCLNNGVSNTFSINGNSRVLTVSFPNSIRGTNCTNNNAISTTLAASACTGTSTWENIGFTFTYDQTAKRVTMRRTSDSKCTMVFTASAHFIMPTILLIIFSIILSFF